MEKNLLTIQDTAEYLSVSTDTIRNFIARGTLPAIRYPGSRRIYIRKDDLDSAAKPVTSRAAHSRCSRVRQRH